MSRPSVQINQVTGNLGRVTTSEDGTSLLLVTGVAVGGQFALNDLLGPFTSLADAEAKGITAAYDTTNTCMAWHHIRDFYQETEKLGVKGVKLYVQVVAKTATLANMTDNTSATLAKKALQLAGGIVRLVGFSRIPDGAYTPAYTTELENDVISAMTNAQALWAAEQALHRPVQIFIEGRNWQGDVAACLDLRTLTHKRVSLVIGQDAEVAAEESEYANYAFVGAVLGRNAAIAVQRNHGRVKDGPITCTTPAFSNGDALTDLTDGNLDTLNDKGYIFGLTHIGLSGVYLNDAPVANAADDDFAYITDGRVMDKADRIAYNVFLQDLLDDVEVDPDTGKLPAPVIKNFQSRIEIAIERQMVDNISSVSAYCDPAQDVLSTSNIEVQITIVPKGTSRKITGKLLFSNPLSE